MLTGHGRATGGINACRNKNEGDREPFRTTNFSGDRGTATRFTLLSVGMCLEECLFFCRMEKARKSRHYLFERFKFKLILENQYLSSYLTTPTIRPWKPPL